MVSTPMKRYLADIDAGILVPDALQKEAVVRLEQCFQRLVQRKKIKTQSKTNTDSARGAILNRLLGKIVCSRGRQKPEPNSLGCYVWGGVGRGKTHIMDYFYESVQGHLNAKRTHFHRFMKEIHDAMHQLKGVANPLEKIAEEYAHAYDVICLDEFVVIDITDAMLLGGLTQALFRNNVVLITTSNAAPNNLYKDGLQRARFLPTIAQLEQNLDVFHLESKNDYRLRHLQRYETYKILDNDDCLHNPLENLYRELVNEEPKSGEIIISGRRIKFQARHNDVIWFRFLDICGDTRSVSDYIEIAQEFHTVLLSGVPVLDRSIEDQSRRFVHLVDEFYDCRVRLFITARVSIPELYQGQRLAFEFERTKSRLVEMQSKDYLGANEGLAPD